MLFFCHPVYVLVPTIGLFCVAITLQAMGIKYWFLVLVIYIGCVIAFVLCLAIWVLCKCTGACHNNSENGKTVVRVHRSKEAMDIKQEAGHSQTGNNDVQTYQKGMDFTAKQNVMNVTSNDMEPLLSYSELQMAPPKYETEIHMAPPPKYETVVGMGQTSV